MFDGITSKQREKYMKIIATKSCNNELKKGPFYDQCSLSEKKIRVVVRGSRE